MRGMEVVGVLIDILNFEARPFFWPSAFAGSIILPAYSKPRIVDFFVSALWR